jgi:sugar lactone lactonase YvrE
MLAMKKRIAYALGLIVVGLAAYLMLWPVPIQPVNWNSPVWPGYVGVHAQNTRLAGLKVIPLTDGSGPEHIVLGKDGKLYTGVNGGKVLRMNPDGSGQEVFAETGGRVAGLDFDAAGNLIAADIYRGLLSISPDRTITVLADRVEGQRIGFADAVTVATNGRIYFSDATTRFLPATWDPGGNSELASLLDILEHSASGRILEYEPATKATRIVARHLAFANGVALSRDERSLFVAETASYRVWKIAVTATNLDLTQPSPQARVLLDNLPGFPDNLTRGLDGRIWLGLAGPRSQGLDDVARKPFMRKLLLRLPSAMVPRPTLYGHVIAFDEDGQVLVDLQDPTGAFPKTTGITETADRLYVHTLNDRGLGWLPR